jgi:hypothetical protein
MDIEAGETWESLRTSSGWANNAGTLIARVSVKWT